MSLAVLLPLSAADLGIVGLSSLPGLFAFVAQLRDRKAKDNFYEDVDGKSTPEAVAAYSNKTSKVLIAALSVAGFGVSLTTSILSALAGGHHTDNLLLENWLTTAAWALILAQAVFIAAHHSSVQVYELGLWVAASSLITAISVITQSVTIAESTTNYKDVALILRAVSGLVAVILTIASTCIPRRPDVFFRDRKIDRQMTVSAFSRFTWGWIKPLIDFAGKKGDLDDEDIPEAPHHIRSEWLMKEWNKYGFKTTLLKSMMWAYRWNFATQYSLTALRCIIGLGPFWTILKFIQILEDMGSNKHATVELWSLVAFLALFKLAEQWLDNFVMWFSLSTLAYPLRGQLSSLVFEKSLRRKNVKMADKAEKADEDPDKQGDESGNNNENENGNGNAKDDTKKDDKKKDDESVLKSKQAVVNLIGVDARRVASWAAMQFYIPNSIGKLLVYSGFLIQLIGWFPFVVGLIAWAIVLPINTIASKKYLAASEDLMKMRDDKLGVVNEALLGMRQIKFSALENQWEKRILAMREKEISTIVRVFKADTVLFGCWILSPICLAAASLTTYALVHKGLSPSVAFVSISIFKSLEVTLGALPELMTMVMDTYVSIKRIDKYLKGPEMKQIITVTKNADVSLENATVAWPVDDEEVPDEDRFILTDISLRFPKGELSVICGKTGSGKSLLLSALLGEVDLLGGSIHMPSTLSALERNDAKAHPGNWILDGAIAYVPQTPWLESTSLRENILFGLPLQEDRYKQVLDVCALTKDVQSLTDGDKTKLGSNGINLSGGQKWRVTLARAIYSRAEILIMDDIFSAVDAHVGRQIFEKCIAGELCKNRTRILVTHHAALAQPKTKFLVELGEGSVLNAGFLSELEEDGTLQKIKSHEQSLAEEVTDTSGLAGDQTAVNSERASVTESAGSSQNEPVKTDDDKDKDAKKFIQDEGKEKGMVKNRVYEIYWRATGGWRFWIVIIILFTAFEAGDIGRTWWVKVWTGSEQGTEDQKANVYGNHGYASGFTIQHSLHAAHTHTVLATEQRSLGFYLGVYIAIAFAGGVLGTLRFLWGFMMSLKGSRSLFKHILFTVMRTPLRWLDTVPVGRVLNRMTADFDVIDNRITIDMALFFWQVMNLVGVCVAASLVSPYTLILGFGLMGISAWIGKLYLDVVRPIKRLESNAKSPAFDVFSAALSGVASLRAYRKNLAYIQKMYGHLDHWNSVSTHLWLSAYWMGLRMSLVGTVFTTIVGCVVIVVPSANAAMAGFAMSFALDFASNILGGIRNYANLEMDMNATERVIEYSELKTENLGGEKPPAAWPTTGKMEVRNLDVAYANDLPLVLKKVSFNVNNNERIGVVGRTGAGKSSLTLALFRFLEPRGGQVIIDGQDISKMDLHSLRSRLAIIPQDPVLFSGTVRTNLDPFENYDDASLRDSLSRVHLVDSTTATPANEPSSAAGSTIAPKNTNIFRDLNSGISESGGNLSQGQRQLLCLARAIVARPKIMVLDEATSAVDMNTDALIQRSIREEFTDSTLIVIAHRLSTIADFDRILVLSDGEVAEFGSPQELWNKEDGIFRDMCNKSGEKEKLVQTIMNK